MNRRTALLLLRLGFQPRGASSLLAQSLLLAFLLGSLTSVPAAEIPFRSGGWKYVLGTGEASNPTDAWRAPGFDDSAWLPSGATTNAPVGYPSGDAGPLEASIQTILPTSAAGGYRCVFLRKTFVVSNAAAVVGLTLQVQYDDGFAAWINGTQIGSANVAEPYTRSTLATDHEVTDNDTFLTPSSGLLMEGTNVLAVQVFNADDTSPDLFLDVQLTSDVDQAPELFSIDPPPNGIVQSLNLINIIFSESVTGVDAADLLMNSVPATGIVTNNPRDYSFTFADPVTTGMVTVAWAANPGIDDVDGMPTAFVPGEPWTYTINPNTFAAAAVISEFMAANDNTLPDEDGALSDWIEIFNPGLVDVNLNGWYLTDTVAKLGKWRFPPTILGPGSFLLVFASEKNRTNSGLQLHTNFKLEASGEYLALVQPDGLTIATEFRPAFPRQTKDISYGRDRVDPNFTGYFVNPTPGAPNTDSGIGFAPEPTFSYESGVYANASLSLVITVPSNSTVRYTFNGTLPTNGSPAYAGPIAIQSNMTIKVRVFPSAAGFFPSRVQVRNFLFLDGSTRDFNSNLPVLVLSTEGRAMSQGVAPGFPRTKGTFVVFDNFLGRSALSRKPDYIGPATFEVFGNTAAGFAKQPYNIELQDASGNDKSESILGLPAEDDWKLRNPFSDKCLMNDFLAFELFEQMGHYSCRRRFVEVFVDTGGGRLSYPGDYIGVEVLLEKIERGKDRVDITELTPAHTTEPAVTGGWILKKDKDSNGDININVNTGGNIANTLKIHEPKPQSLRNVPTSGSPTTYTPNNFSMTNYTPSATNQLNWLLRYLAAVNASLTGAGFELRTGTNHYSHYLDVDSFVDQHWIVEFTKQIDGYRVSNFFTKDRGGKIKNSPIWDWNLSFGNADYLQGGLTNGWYYTQIGGGDHPYLRSLLGGASLPNSGGDPDFIQKVIDRWGVLRTNIMNGERLLARIDELANLLTDDGALSSPVTRNFAKHNNLNTLLWPNPQGPPAWHVDYTQPTYAGIISEMKKWTMGRHLWIDGQFPKAPVLSLSEGDIVAGSSLEIAAPAGTIYYTLDGSDPRASRANGAVSPTALAYSGTVLLNHNARVFARARVGTTWSAPATATYVGQRPRLVITEIMYHPMGPATGSGYDQEQFQFIELKNTDVTSIGVGGIRFSSGIDFTFPSSNLPPGQYLLVVKNRAAFEQRYGPDRPIAGEFQGSLAFSGERLALVDVVGQSILDFEYSDRWHGLTDGPGLSLVASVEQAAASEFSFRRGWKPSRLIHGSPGRPEPASIPFVTVVINEVLSNPLPPNEDAVEILNPTANEADVSFWYLTDDFDQPRKFQIPPGTFVPAFWFLAFDEHTFNPSGTSFSFNADGDGVYLYSADEAGDLTGYVHGFRFGEARTNESFGRYLDENGAELFVPQSGITFGQPNSGPVVLPVGLRPTLALTELMFDPGPVPAGNTNAAADMEFIEIKNIGPDPIDLGGVEFVAGIRFTFPAVILTPGQYALIVRNRAAFASRYGTNLPVIGEFSGGLAAEGERVTLVGSVGEPVLDFTYNSAPFPLTRDFGLSLVLADEQAPRESYSSPASWRTGSIEGGSPGRADSTVIDPILINELLTHTDPPQVDAIELFNPMGTVVNVGGWWLSDDFDKPKKYQIPEPTLITPAGFTVIYENGFTNPEVAAVPFSLSSKGDDVYLFSGDGTNLTGYFQGHSFEAAANGVSFGRYTNSQTNVHFVAQSTLTLGSANAGPRVGPIVISEINYRPVDLPGGRDNVIDEYIELANITGFPVTLFDPLNPTSTWRLRGSNEFNFPPGVILPAGGYLLLVRFNPEEASVLNEFRSRLNLHASVPIFGPYASRLDNAGGRLQLLRPVAGDLGEILHILTDEVDYRSNSPWPIYADGTGASLQRIVADEYGNDPVNWRAALPSPGSPGRFNAGDDPPVFVTQPVNIVGVAGASARLEVTAAEAPPMSYQWFFGGKPIPGASNNVLVLTNLKASQSGQYVLYALNPFGVARSSPATVTVLVPPNIYENPSSQAVRDGTNVTFNVVAGSANPPLRFQWLFNGVPIPHATNSSYSLTGVNEFSEGTYSVTCTDGNGTIESAPAELTVLIPPGLLGPIPPLSLVAVPGDTMTLGTEIRGTKPIWLQWRKFNLAGVNQGLLKTGFVNANQDFLVVPNVSTNAAATNSAGIYTVQFTNIAGGSLSTTSIRTNAILTVRGDANGNGIDDHWESTYLGAAADPDADSDGDGMSNRAEYIAGTNPADTASYLKVDRLIATGAVKVEFLAVSNRTYAIESAAELAGGGWTRVAEVVAGATNRVIVVLDPTSTTGTTQRVYRLVTPRQP